MTAGHDYDPVTLKCRRCTVHATQGIAVCTPPDDSDPVTGGRTDETAAVQQTPEIDEQGDWHAVVQQSFLDSRVWIAVIPDADNYTNMGASTSVRRVKAYAFETAVTALMGRDPTELVWHREGDDWVLRDGRWQLDWGWVGGLFDRDYRFARLASKGSGSSESLDIRTPGILDALHEIRDELRGIKEALKLKKKK